VVPRHIRRSIEAIETILSHPGSIPVGHIVSAPLFDDCANIVEKVPAEIMNVEIATTTTYYYVHYIGKPKRYDDWIPEEDISEFGGIDSIRSRIEEPSSEGGISPWSQFFQLSQLNKQTTAGSSAYGSSASSAHHDPHEYSPKTVRGVDFGNGNKIRSWYRSPYPPQYWSRDQHLRVCHGCLQYGIDPNLHECGKEGFDGHGEKIVYEKDNIAVFEFDGNQSVSFCVRLFLLAKLFLEDKRTSAVDEQQISQVTPFFFYVLAEKSMSGEWKFKGYFSKYKIHKRDGPILSCILVLPSEQRKGYGKLLISIAYELAKREGKQGSAERPLSGPGLAAFLSWWTWKLKSVISNCYDGEVLSISQLSDLSGMTSEDVVETLKNCGALKQWNSAGGGDVKLRESGKRAKIKLTMDIYNALKTSKGVSSNEFDPSRLSDNVRLSQTVASTPTK